MQWSKKSAYGVGAIFSVLIACSGEVHDHDDLREDVLYCEEAVSALASCCPGFDPHSVSCQYSYDYYPSTGCEDNSRTYETDPDFKVGQSQCILNTTCADLQARGVCNRALVSKEPCR